MNKYKPTGWKYESQRHSLAAKGIKTKINYAKGIFHSEKMSDIWDSRMQWVYNEAESLINLGATPAFHLGPEVGPHITFMVEDEKDYEKYDVTKDYPFISAQATGVSLDKWAEATGYDRKEINVLYLGINGPVSEMHNASVSLLDADSNEWDSYVDDKWSNVNSMDNDDIKLLKKGYDNGELVSVNDQDPHADFYYEYGNKNAEERYKLGKQLIEAWMEDRGQKKISEFIKPMKQRGTKK